MDKNYSKWQMSKRRKFLNHLKIMLVFFFKWKEKGRKREERGKKGEREERAREGGRKRGTEGWREGNVESGKGGKEQMDRKS